MNVDVKHKFIRQYQVTDAATHDSHMIHALLDKRNRSRDVFADGAYHSQAIRARLKAQGYRDRIHRKGCRDAPLTERDRRSNRIKSKIRVRVEHVFGRQAQKARRQVDPQHRDHACARRDWLAEPDLQSRTLRPPGRRLTPDHRANRPPADQMFRPRADDHRPNHPPCLSPDRETLNAGLLEVAISSI